MAYFQGRQHRLYINMYEGSITFVIVSVSQYALHLHLQQGAATALECKLAALQRWVATD